MTTSALQQTSSVKSLTSLSDLLTRYKEQIAMALPKHLTAERMIRVALTAVSRNPLLQECNPATVAGCVVQASILGLEPDGVLGEAYLVPFWNKKANNNRGARECQLIVGYQGLLKLVRNTGELKMIDVQEVCANDEFDYEKGLEPYLRHKPSMGERGPIQRYWAGAVMVNGGSQFEVMSVEDIEAHRDKYSKAKDFGPWKDSPEWMFKKTVLRKLVKLLPKSAQAQLAVALDERAEAGIPQHFSVDVPLELQQSSAGEPEAGSAEPPVNMPRRISEATQETPAQGQVQLEFNPLAESEGDYLDAKDAKKISDLCGKLKLDPDETAAKFFKMPELKVDEISHEAASRLIGDLKERAA